MTQSAFGIEAEAEEGIERALAWVRTELGMSLKQNPDLVLLRHGLFSVEDARKVFDHAQGAPLTGNHKVLIITADRAYHEAQNALLKVFEEPPAGVHLFLVVPSFGGLLPTLRSRLQILDTGKIPSSAHSELAHDFLSGTIEKRQALIKKLTSGKDDVARNKNREVALSLIQHVEAAVVRTKSSRERTTFLGELATLRGYFHERSAPIKLALEHLALVLPKDLV